jgi:ubiquinone/menaquinone biosynthesis C-methylase UbiE
MHHTHHDPIPHTEGNLIRWAPFYDTVVSLLTLGKAKSLRAQTAALAMIQPGERILDVGCGTGDLTMTAKRLAGTGGTVIGIDASPEMIEVAQRKATRAHVEIEYRVALIEAIPFPDASFDVVLSSMMMHHLPDHLKQAGLAEIRRVLKPNGRVVIVDMKGSAAHRLSHSPLAWLHHGVERGIEDVMERMKQTGFQRVEGGNMTLPMLGYATAMNS